VELGAVLERWSWMELGGCLERWSWVEGAWSLDLGWSFELRELGTLRGAVVELTCFELA
jgi:hypothetical protein